MAYETRKRFPTSSYAEMVVDKASVKERRVNRKVISVVALP